MNLFKKKSPEPNRLHWRDETGKIRCDDKHCPHFPCDENCPIYWNTEGLKRALKNQPTTAISAYKRALEIAPDFADAWNNLGAAYGLTSSYRQAFTAYEKAYNIGKKPNALYGLALSARDCGYTDAAIRYCEEYREKFPDGRLDSVYYSLTGKQNEPKYSAVSITGMLLDIARDQGILTSEPNVFPKIPEIMVLAKKTIYPMILPIVEDSKIDPPYDPNEILLIWSAYAGIGGVYLWHTQFGKLKQYALYDLLTTERGIDQLDEYVSDLVGAKWESPAGHTLRHILWQYADACMYFIKKVGQEVHYDNSITRTCFEAMFYFGMIYEMEQLGMR